jgi:hypothetical protein
VDFNEKQPATAEIEDSKGTTHHVEVQVNWETDSLVGKMVKTTSCSAGISLCPAD